MEIKNRFNKYLDYIKNNKNNFYIIGAIVVLFLISTGLIALIAGGINKNSPTNSNVPSSTISPVPSENTSQTTVNEPIITPDPTQAAIIKDQAAPQITPNISVS